MKWDRGEFLSRVPTLAAGAAAVLPTVGSPRLAQQGSAEKDDGAHFCVFLPLKPEA
jgi:hypothetical protein